MGQHFRAEAKIKETKLTNKSIFFSGFKKILDFNDFKSTFANWLSKKFE